MTDGEILTVTIHVFYNEFHYRAVNSVELDFFGPAFLLPVSMPSIERRRVILTNNGVASAIRKKLLLSVITSLWTSHASLISGSKIFMSAVLGRSLEE